MTAPMTTNVGPNPVDRNQYGDQFSSCERRFSTGVDSIGINTLAMVGGRAPRTYRYCTKLRFHMRSALAIGGVVNACLYYGPDPTALTYSFPPFPATADFTPTGLRQIIIPTVDVVEGWHYYFTWIRTGLAILAPTISACGDNTISDLVNPNPLVTGLPVSGTKSATTHPTTLDITTGWTANGRIPWWALAL